MSRTTLQSGYRNLPRNATQGKKHKIAVAGRDRLAAAELKLDSSRAGSVTFDRDVTVGAVLGALERVAGPAGWQRLLKKAERD